ncbi:MAG: response regulator, partial [Gammaproteobacteria bacterium]|nr:response regulator [Gammaproteobacteria bacterium]
FDVFSQINDQYNKRHQGVGIGLSNAARFVSLLNGQITVKSEVNQGSEFTVSIPAKPQSMPVSILNQKSNKLYNVLVVDDNPVALNIIVSLATQIGWTAQGTKSADEALKLIEEHAKNGHSFDIILTDWDLPDTDGLQMAEQLAQLDAELNSPLIILVSAHSRVELNKAIQKYEHSPIDGYLSKPVTPYSLLDAVEDALAFNRKELPPTLDQQLEGKPLKNLHILIVEDNAVNQEIAQSLLMSAGATCEIASGGMAAISLISKSSGRFNLILMDIQMPDLDGYETTLIIRKDPNYHSIPIIAMTANVLQRDKEQCMRAGMNAHIGKPYNIDTLINTIYSVLGLDESNTDQHNGTSSTNREANVPDAILNYCHEQKINIQPALELLNGSFELYFKSTRICDRQLTEVMASLIPEQTTIAELKATCHSLKTSTKSLGFVDVTAEIENIEADCQKDQLQDATAPALTNQLITVTQTAKKHCNIIISKV